MIRDTVKDEQYYAEIIPQLEQRILKYEKKRDEYPVDSSQYEKCQIHLQGICYHYLSALFSSGAPALEVKAAVERYLTTITVASVTYNLLIDAYSLALLFDVAHMCDAVVKQNKHHDILIDTLAQHFTKGMIEISEFNPAYYEYQPFADYLRGRTSTEEFLMFIENDWYNVCSDRAWHESDKKASAVYTGYWCWLGGAMLKMKHEIITGQLKYIPLLF